MIFGIVMFVNLMDVIKAAAILVGISVFLFVSLYRWVADSFGKKAAKSFSNNDLSFKKR